MTLLRYLLIGPYFILVYFCFFGPRFYAADTHLWAGMISVCFGAISFFLSPERYKQVFIYILLSLIPLGYVLTIQFTNHTFALGQAGSYSILKMIFYSLVAVGLIYISELMAGQERACVFLFKSIIFAAAINATTIVPMLNDGFRGIAYTYIHFSQDAELFVTYSNRVMDIGIGGGDATSMAYCGFMLVGLYVLFFQKRIIAKLLCLAAITIIILMSILCGRTGQLIILMMLGLFLAISILGQLPKDHPTRSLFKSQVVALAILLACGIPAVIAAFFFLEGTMLDNVYYNMLGIWDRAFSHFSGTHEGTEQVTSTIYVVWDMLTTRWPTGVHLLAGDGNFGRMQFLPEVHADPGWVRIVYGMGILGTILYLIPYSYTIREAWKVRKFDWRGDLYLLLVFLTFFSNLKAWAFAQKGLGLVTLVVFFSIFLLKPGGKQAPGVYGPMPQPIPPPGR